MDWTEITISVPCAQAETATAIAHMVANGGVYVEDYSDLEEGARAIAHMTLMDEALLAKDRTRAQLHLYLSADQNPAEATAFLQERYTAEGIDGTLSARTVQESDWANNWKQYFKPKAVGERLIICPTWETVEPPDGRTVLWMDPGMAFGTGGHDTTRLVLETLEQHIQSGDSVLDVGCGSGILSIASLLLGAEQATGVDIDPTAVRTARENGERNGCVPPRYVMRVGDLATEITGRYRVIVANIVADAIIALSPAVRPLMAENGVYIVSGIIDTREADVVQALTDGGFAVAERHEAGGWLCLVVK